MTSNTLGDKVVLTWKKKKAMVVKGFKAGRSMAQLSEEFGVELRAVESMIRWHLDAQ